MKRDDAYERVNAQGQFRRTYPSTWPGRWQLESGAVSVDEKGRQWRMTNDVWLTRRATCRRRDGPGAMTVPAAPNA